MSSSRGSSSALLQRSNRQRSHPEAAIKHSGRAHIRGKIRRVWRPRYLELVGNTFEHNLVAFFGMKEEKGIAFPHLFPCLHLSLALVS